MNKLEKITYLVFVVLILIFMIILHNSINKSIKLSEEILKYNQPEAIRLIDDSEYYKDTKKLTEIMNDKDILEENNVL